MKRLLVLFSLLFAQAAQAGYDEALELARKGNYRVFLVFSAKWCKSCQALRKSVLDDPAISSFIKQHYVVCDVDVDEQPQVASLYKDYVKGLPACLVVNGESKICDQLDGSVPPGDFTSWLLDTTADKPLHDFKKSVDAYVGWRGRLVVDTMKGTKFVYMNVAGVPLFDVYVHAEKGKWYVTDTSKALPGLDVVKK